VVVAAVVSPVGGSGVPVAEVGTREVTGVGAAVVVEVAGIVAVITGLAGRSVVTVDRGVVGRAVDPPAVSPSPSGSPPGAGTPAIVGGEVSTALAASGEELVEGSGTTGGAVASGGMAGTPSPASGTAPWTRQKAGRVRRRRRTDIVTGRTADLRQAEPVNPWRQVGPQSR